MAKETSKGRETARVDRSPAEQPEQQEMDEFNQDADAVFAADERPPLATQMHPVAQQPEDGCPNCGAEWHAPQIMTVSLPDGAERHCTDCNLAWRIVPRS